jgi:hypothetical protein
VVGEKNLEEKTIQYLSQADLADKIHVQDYQYDPLTGIGVLKNIKIKNLDTRNFYLKHIDKIEIRKYKVDKKTPVDVEFAIYGLTAESKEKKIDDIVKLDIFLKYSYHPEKKEFSIKKLEVKAPEFRFFSSLELENFDEIILEKILTNNKKEFSKFDSFLFISKLLQIKPTDLYIEFEDNGLLEKLLEKEAVITGKSKETLRREFLDKINKDLLKAKTDIEKEILKGIKNILENKKGKFILAVKSRREISFQDLIAIFMKYQFANVSSEEKIKMFSAELEKYFDIKFKFIKES